MSRQELRDDMKQTEGNPQIKARIRKIQRSVRRQQTATAPRKLRPSVVTNPTHYAVALRYELEMEAPVVVSKGRDLLAQKIKDVARWQATSRLWRIRRWPRRLYRTRRGRPGHTRETLHRRRRNPGRDIPSPSRRCGSR